MSARLGSRLRRMARHPVVGASGLRVLGTLLGVVASVIIARLGGAEVKGIASAYAAANALAFLVVNLDLAQQVLKDGRRRADLRSVPRRIVRLWPLYAALAGVVMLLGFVLGGGVAWLAAGTFAFLVGAQLGMISNALAGPMIAAWGAVLQQVGMAIGAAIVALTYGLDTDSVRAIIILSYLVPMPLFAWAVLKKSVPPAVEPVLPPQGLDRLVRGGLTWQPARLAQFVMMRADTLLVFAWLGPAAAGVYSVGLATATLAGLVPAQFAAVTTYSATMSLGGSARTNAVRALYTGAGASVVLVAVGYPLILVAYGAEFSEAYGVLVVSSVGVTGYGVLQVLTAHARIVSGPQIITMSSMAGASAMLISLAALVPTFGLLGAAAASSLGPCVAVAVAAALLRRKRAFGTGTPGDRDL
ncbi:lipopolysaccharide biosynthesis protein [Aeromicrobium sp. CF4.19]|uniref:lipopolysaccharide biosynthesis protein n=1 Tax=Aeromicrobium sp. CF4.19 TaxID=3373082 RepID=UPI003EE5EEC4